MDVDKVEVDKGKKKAAGEADPMDVDKGKAAVEGTDEEEIEDNLRTEPGAGTDEERDLRDHPEPRPPHVPSRPASPGLPPRPEGSVGKSLMRLTRPRGLPPGRGWGWLGRAAARSPELARCLCRGP